MTGQPATPTVGVVPVTQADRDAAADFCKTLNTHTSRELQLMRNGRFDESDPVQIVAAHRRTAQAELVEALKAILKAPMIDHQHPERSAYGIARLALARAEVE